MRPQSVTHTRRRIVQGIAATTALSIAGCSRDSGGGSNGFDSSVSGPYLWVESSEQIVYAAVELQGSPSEYPTKTFQGDPLPGYAVGIQQGDQGIETGRHIKKIPNLSIGTSQDMISKKRFESTNPTKILFVLGSNSEIESGTTFSLYLLEPGVAGNNISTEVATKVGEVTYEGSPTDKSPEPQTPTGQ